MPVARMKSATCVSLRPDPKWCVRSANCTAPPVRLVRATAEQTGAGLARQAGLPFWLTSREAADPAPPSVRAMPSLPVAFDPESGACLCDSSQLQTTAELPYDAGRLPHDRDRLPAAARPIA